MRVCMLTTSYPRHGDDFAGTFVYSLARELARRDVEVVVVAPHDGRAPRREVQGLLSVHRFVYAWPVRWQKLAYGDGIPGNLRRHLWVAGLIPFFLAAFLWAAWHCCAGCDVIHVHWAPLGWIGLLLRLWYRIPLVVTVHGTDVRALPVLLVRPVLKWADAVVAAATETESLLREMEIGYHSIALPIDEDLFRPGMEASGAAEEIGLQVGEQVVTFVGRLNEFKDPMTLVRAIPLVLAQCPQTRFVIIGDGPLAPAVRTAVSELGIERAVCLLGGRRDVGRFLALSDLFVALSPVENAWSMTIAEAMHMGVPCIITRAGRTEQLFTHGENAYLIEVQDYQALSEAILYLLDRRDQRQRLAQGALELLRKHGKDTESIVRRTLALYKSLLETNLQRPPRTSSRKGRHEHSDS